MYRTLIKNTIFFLTLFYFLNNSSSAAMDLRDISLQNEGNSKRRAHLEAQPVSPLDINDSLDAERREYLRDKNLGEKLTILYKLAEENFNFPQSFKLYYRKSPEKRVKIAPSSRVAGDLEIFRRSWAGERFGRWKHERSISRDEAVRLYGGYKKIDTDREMHAVLRSPPLEERKEEERKHPEALLNDERYREENEELKKGMQQLRAQLVELTQQNEDIKTMRAQKAAIQRENAQLAREQNQLQRNIRRLRAQEKAKRKPLYLSIHQLRQEKNDLIQQNADLRDRNVELSRVFADHLEIALGEFDGVNNPHIARIRQSIHAKLQAASLEERLTAIPILGREVATIFKELQNELKTARQQVVQVHTTLGLREAELKTAQLRVDQHAMALEATRRDLATAQAQVRLVVERVVPVEKLVDRPSIYYLVEYRVPQENVEKREENGGEKPIIPIVLQAPVERRKPTSRQMEMDDEARKMRQKVRILTEENVQLSADKSYLRDVNHHLWDQLRQNAQEYENLEGTVVQIREEFNDEYRYVKQLQQESREQKKAVQILVEQLETLRAAAAA